jgi:hypothetical protein
MHRLFTEIEKFEQWAVQYSDIPQDDRGGQWECDYDYWQDIYDQFTDFLESVPLSKWTSSAKDKLLYIIARDSEMEVLSDTVHGKALIELAEHSLQNGSPDAKWQLAVKLSRLKDKNTVIELLERFVNDSEEYVNRRALMELARFDPQKAELYCEKFWKRRIYEEDEIYQRIAVLQTLAYLQSPLLLNYLAEAKSDGREYLLQYAIGIEEELKGDI